jgi:hypothetical protein
VAYLDVAGFRTKSTIPTELVDKLEAKRPGFLTWQLEYHSRKSVDGRLAKRYAAPFDETDPPAHVVGWLVDLVTEMAYEAAGAPPNNPQATPWVARAELARTEIKEAADAKDGLFELPLRDDTTATGVTRGFPLAYNETSPYVWQDVQAEAGKNEDADRGR